MINDCLEKDQIYGEIYCGEQKDKRRCFKDILGAHHSRLVPYREQRIVSLRSLSARSSEYLAPVMR